MGPQRHLDLVVNNPLNTSVPAGTDLIPWPVPFADGIAILASLRGQKVAVLASGDPFWFGAGSVIARSFGPDEWTAIPGSSCFSLAAARLGWPLETTTCLGLHAAPFARLRPHLAPGAHLIVTLRDGDAVPMLGNYLDTQGFGNSTLHVMEHLGGPLDRLTRHCADAITGTFDHPVCVAIEVAGDGPALTSASGQTDASFQSDGQITKRPMRAITLSTLAPKPGEHLWDIGGGSGSIALEWLLAHPSTTATSVEARADRAARITQNALDLGLEHRLTVIEGSAPDALAELKEPNAIFVGGGLSKPVLDTALATSARIVANAVTLEGEALLSAAQATNGGELMRIALSNATPLGPKRGWTSAYPVVQWSLDR